MESPEQQTLIGQEQSKRAEIREIVREEILHILGKNEKKITKKQREALKKKVALAFSRNVYRLSRECKSRLLGIEKKDNRKKN